MTSHILVVDDDPIARELLRRRLQAEKYSVALAPDARAAFEEIDRQRPDLMICDRMMPGLDGVGVVQRLRQLPGVDRIPVIMVTALDSPEDRVAGLDAGADDYIGKPFDFAELLARLRSLLRRSPAPAATVGALPEDGSGFIAGVSLFSVLQMLQLEQKWCVLAVTAPGRSGEMTFENGEVAAATAGELHDEAAVVEILSWDDARMLIRAAGAPLGQRLATPLSHLIMDALRLMDERAANQPTPAPPATTTAALPAVVASPAPAIPAGDEADHLWFDPREVASAGSAIDGSVGAAVVHLGDSQAWVVEDRQTFDVSRALAEITHLVQVEVRTMRAAGLDEQVEDILFTLGGHYHLIRLLGDASRVFLYLVFDRTRTNLALARRTLDKIIADVNRDHDRRLAMAGAA